MTTSCLREQTVKSRRVEHTRWPQLAAIQLADSIPCGSFWRNNNYKIYLSFPAKYHKLSIMLMFAIRICMIGIGAQSGREAELGFFHRVTRHHSQRNPV